MPSEDYIDKERIAKLEAKMDAVLAAMNARGEFQTEVISRLAVIQNKQDDFKECQRTCEAERKAHDNRLMTLENARNSAESSRKTLLSLFGGVGGIASFAVSLVTIYTLIRHT
jgi:hypothetical protein